MVDISIEIEVAYAGKNQQKIIRLEVQKGCTVQEAIEESGILNEFEELKPFIQNISLLEGKVGIFGRGVMLARPLKAEDRVEIYRPLYQDPKEARRKRIKKKKS